MEIKTIKSEGLVHNSYYLSDEHEAVVIDPGAIAESTLNLPKKTAQKSNIS